MLLAEAFANLAFLPDPSSWHRLHAQTAAPSLYLSPPTTDRTPGQHFHHIFHQCPSPIIYLGQTLPFATSSSASHALQNEAIPHHHLWVDLMGQ